MLNQETRRRIDAARDILVGKVPDPKAQVEQITTALIYKFMDDMDQESLDLGGTASFFVQEYEKYAWNKLLDTRLGGLQRLNLYVEALEKMPQNPQLPELFRNILKGAFLPYRDPETLNLFLKEINGFTYDHSEKLGDAFEYLLSIMSSQGDAGQFRTPRHIIDFIVEVLDPKKDETILDPACGTAGFLISSYKHILKQNTNEIAGDQLTPDDRARLMNNFVGYDISPDMVRLSLVNMYLHSFPNPNAYEYDTLTSEERWGETYDIIMANPPFMTPKGGIRPHKRFSIQANRSEVLFVDYIAEHLNTSGRAGIIVPEGIIFQSGKAYKALRKILVEKYLYAVVSLPAGIFQPYSSVKTSILLMDKQLAKSVDNILFVKVENDGLDLGAQRRAIEKNDLPQALDILNQYQHTLKGNADAQRLSSLVEAADLANIVPKAKIAKSGDYNLSGGRYRETKQNMRQKWSLVELGILCKAVQYGLSKDMTDEPVGYKIFRMGEIQNGNINDTGKMKYVTITKQDFDKYRLNKGDLLFNRTNSYELVGKVGIFNLEGEYCFASYLLRLIINEEMAVPSFINFLLNGKEAQEKFKSLATRSVSQANINAKNLQTLLIPLPPLSVQKEVVAQIESYQKIIDGAKQIVTNYKPSVRSDLTWRIVTLGYLIEIKTGKLDSNQAVEDGKYPFFTCSKQTYKINSYAFDCEAILLAGNNASGDFNVKYYKGKFNAYQRTYVITIKDTLLITYPFLFMELEKQLINLKESSIGSNTKYLRLGMIQDMKVFLPSLETQEKIVAQIEEEQHIVNANKRLIEIFEQKIKDKIAEVWQTEEDTPIPDTEEIEASADAIEEASEKVEIRQAELFSLL